MLKTRYVALLAATTLLTPTIASAHSGAEHTSDAAATTPTSAAPTTGASTTATPTSGATTTQAAPSSDAAPKGEAEEEAGSAASAESKGKKCGEHFVIEGGHVDITAGLEDGALKIGVEDATKSFSDQSEDRELEEVIFGIRDIAKKKRADVKVSDKLDFLNAKDETFYALPNVVDPNIVSPGYETMDVDYSQLNGAINYHLEPASLPAGATWGLFLTKNIDDVKVLTSSVSKKYDIQIAEPSHAHVHWVFNKPGTYVFNASYNATSKDGKALTTGVHKLTFAIGDEAIKNCAPENAAPTTTTQATTTQATTTPVTTTAVTTTAAPSSTATTTQVTTTSATATPASQTTVTTTSAKPTTTPAAATATATATATAAATSAATSAPVTTTAAPNGSSTDKNGSSTLGIIIPVAIVGVLGVLAAFLITNPAVANIPGIGDLLKSLGLK